MHYPLFLLTYFWMVSALKHIMITPISIVLYENWHYTDLVSENAYISNLIAIFPCRKISYVNFASCLHIMNTNECISPCMLNTLATPIIWKRNIELTFTVHRFSNCALYYLYHEASVENKHCFTQYQIINQIHDAILLYSRFRRFDHSYRKTSSISRTKSQNLNVLVSSCSCFRSIHWSQVLSWEWRCSWSSADRRCSNCIRVINNFIAY